MRFGVKPERPGFLDRARARYNTYKVPSESEDSSSDDQFEEEVVESSDSEDSFCYASESEIPVKSRPKSTPRKTVEEQRELTEAMASIQLHANYQDPLEEWKKRSQKEAFNSARARMRHVQTKAMSTYMTSTKLGEMGLEVLAKQQNAHFAKLVEQRFNEREAHEREERKQLEERNRRLWEQVDQAAAVVEARLEAERKVSEAKEQQMQEEKTRKEQAEREKKEKIEAEKRRLAEEKLKAAEEERKQKEVDEKERIQAEEKQRLERDLLSRFDKERKAAGITTSKEDWDAAMTTNWNIKGGHLKRVKEDSVQRRQWNSIRRGITLRIGQLTDSEEEIDRISTQIFDTLCTLDPNSDIYPSALSALAKVIILQAETEVTAKLDTAGPLAAVVINLFNLPGFDEVLWAKMVMRTGGWLIGHCVTRQPGQEETVFRKMAAYREDEVPTDRQTRIGGVLSLYFAISTSSKATKMLPANFWPTKIWSFFARIVGDARLLRQTMAPYVSLRLYSTALLHQADIPLTTQLMHSSLEVVASAGVTMFGKQWIKMLIAIGQATLEDGRVGSTDDAGKTARIRLQLKAEKLLGDYGLTPSRT